MSVTMALYIAWSASYCCTVNRFKWSFRMCLLPTMYARPGILLRAPMVGLRCKRACLANKGEQDQGSAQGSDDQDGSVDCKLDVKCFISTFHLTNMRRALLSAVRWQVACQSPNVLRAAASNAAASSSTFSELSENASSRHQGDASVSPACQLSSSPVRGFASSGLVLDKKKRFYKAVHVQEVDTEHGKVRAWLARLQT